MSISTPSEQAPGSPPSGISDKQLTLMEHLKELRFRLFVSAVAVIIGLGITAWFGQDVIRFLKQPGEAADPEFELQFIEPFELFVAYFRVALLGGLIFGMPVIVYQALRFVSPGLSSDEKRWVYLTVIGATGLFLGGVAFAYYIALPPALGFLLNFGGDLARPDLRISSYIDFVTRLLFLTGITFQTPIVVMYLSRFGIVSPRQLIRWWRLAIVAAFVVAAIVTPTIDPVTQSLIAGPIIVLYFLGIVLAYIVTRGR